MDRAVLANDSGALLWLDDLYALVRETKLDSAIDMLFERIDTLLSHDDYEICNTILSALDVERLDTNLAVAVLAITFPAKERLKEARPALVKRIERRLRELNPERADQLLAGRR